jgi:DNA-binding response OmpR family regulator
VTRGDTRIELTAREFSLLEYLMRHAGEVVGRFELMEHVWQAYGASEANVVEVYIGYLRRKVDAPFGRRSVTTVRGAGYRLEPDGG